LTFCNYAWEKISYSSHWRDSDPARPGACHDFSGAVSHVVLEELYYIPIFWGALRFGLQGAILVYLFASLSYLPFFFGQWSLTNLDLLDRVLHLLFSALFAFLTGYLIERDRKMRKQAAEDRSLRGIGQAATAIVHDLKNPLISILGFARRIREGKGNPVEAADIISSSAENMQRIVHDVLDFSKPLQLTYIEEDMGCIVRQAVDLCKTKAEDAQVNLLIDIPELPMAVEVDRFQVQRALVNLINNAIEASNSEQGVTISVNCGKSSLNIVIQDHGAGMDAGIIENIFTPFYTRKRGGTGLGMPIAKKIIDNHHGRITVNSRSGRGTVVTVEFPRFTPMDRKR
jgi:signal transduction histidine kinase